LSINIVTESLERTKRFERGRRARSARSLISSNRNYFCRVTGLSAFEKGLCWSLYKYMEADFVHFLEYVPYTDYNSKVYSPKLLAMLLQACGYIDTVFKEMAKFSDFKNIPECQAINALEPGGYKEYNIGLARTAFEKVYSLSSNNRASLIAKLDWVGDKSLLPFEKFGQGQSPDWWREYNNVKHTWSSAIEQANMDNVLLALAGAFLLNAIHYPSIELLWRLGVLKTVVRVSGGYTDTHMPESMFQSMIQKAISGLKPIGYDIAMETPLFLYVKMTP